MWFKTLFFAYPLGKRIARHYPLITPPMLEIASLTNKHEIFHSEGGTVVARFYPCMEDNPLAKSCGLSPRTGRSNMV